MKIIQAKGQTCNQFWIYSNYLADCLEIGGRMFILAPDVTINDYPKLLNNPIIKYPLYPNFLSKSSGCVFYIRLLNVLFSNKYSKKCSEIICKFIPRVTFINGKMGVYKSPFKAKYSEISKEFFAPALTLQNEVSAFFNNLKAESDVIMGVHIRRGDYKNFLNGKYYYSDEQYYSIMLQVKKILYPQKVAFFIASNERVNLTGFKDCFCCVLPQSSATKDLFALSLSDYIIGPPSTYSGWASYYGNVRLYQVQDIEYKFEINDFKCVLFEDWG